MSNVTLIHWVDITSKYLSFVHITTFREHLLCCNIDGILPQTKNVELFVFVQRPREKALTNRCQATSGTNRKMAKNVIVSARRRSDILSK